MLRLVFGLKKKAQKKVLVAQSSFVNSQEVQLKTIISCISSIKRKQNETF